MTIELPPIHIPTVDEALSSDADDGGGRVPVFPFWRGDDEFRLRYRMLPVEGIDDPRRWWIVVRRYVFVFPCTTEDEEAPVAVGFPEPIFDGHDPVRRFLYRMRDEGRIPDDLVNRLMPKMHALTYGFLRKGKGIEIPPRTCYRVVPLPYVAYVTMRRALDALGRQARPVDPDGGHDFIMVRTVFDDGRVTYADSTFDDRVTPLTDEEREYVARHGWYDLSEVVEKLPPEATASDVVALVEASLRGEPFDPERWPWANCRPAYTREIEMMKTIERRVRLGSRIKARPAAGEMSASGAGPRRSESPTWENGPVDADGREKTSADDDDANPIEILRRRIQRRQAGM